MRSRSRKLCQMVVPASLFALVALIGIRIGINNANSLLAGYALMDVNNLRHIYLVSFDYALQNGGRFPDDWSVLSSDSSITPEVFRTYRNRGNTFSLTNVHSWTDYVYARGLTTNSPDGTVFAYSPPSNQRGKYGAVVYVGGSGETFRRDEWMKFEMHNKSLDRIPGTASGTDQR